MKAIILAAGKSSRLYPITLERPKCLLEVGKQSIIERQIDMLNKQGIDDILVVVGYKKEVIRDAVGDKVRYAEYNDYEKTNNLFTLWSIKDELDDDFILLFSDVIIEENLMNECINSSDDFCLLVHDKEVLEGTMRVTIEDNSIINIGSHIPVLEGDGNFIGIAKYSKKAACLLKEQLSEMTKDDSHINDYYTLSLIDIAQKGEKIGFILSGEKKWIEIDTKEDLDQARKIFN